VRYVVFIESLASGGAGVTHLPDGKVAFVPGGLPGDQASIEVHADKGRFARASLAELLQAGPDRIAAACEYSGRCGGCVWQSLGYAAQLQWKRRFVVDALTRVGGLGQAETLVGDVIMSPKQWHYRNKVEFSLFVEGGQATGAAATGRASGRLCLGMHGQGDERPVAVKRCLLLPDGLSDMPGKLSGALNYLLGKEPLKPYRVGIRHSERTGLSELALWSMPGGMQRAFVAQRLGEVMATGSTVRVLTRGEGAERDVAKVEVLSGRGRWAEELAGQRFSVSAPSFFQVNTMVAEAMVGQVLELADPSGRHVWDLYSGVGSFSLPLAAAGAKVTAVELAGSSIRDLRRNLSDSGLDGRVTVAPGDVARAIGGLSAPDLAVVDPPRSGLGRDVVARLAESAARELIYVSCDPQTLARDAAWLAEAGFALQAASPYDLFPQSPHIEVITHFRR
jgi:23S rRNA (uracil1939-C5)-methyltransferase